MLTLCTVVERMVLYGPGGRHVSRIDNHRCQVPRGCSTLGVQFVGNPRKGALNRKHKQTSKQQKEGKNGKRLLFSTFYSLPGTGYTEDLSRRYLHR